jgi:hypothetical protein
MHCSIGGDAHRTGTGPVPNAVRICALRVRPRSYCKEVVVNEGMHHAVYTMWRFLSADLEDIAVPKRRSRSEHPIVCVHLVCEYVKRYDLTIHVLLP